jgi:glycosyltransferase involved in cell wall biosynthesis
MSDTIIIQRLMPHYRAGLFQALYDRFGWLTVVAENAPNNTFLAIESARRPHLYPMRYNFTSPDNAFVCKIPVAQALAELKPRRVISEFSMRNNAWHALLKARLTGRIERYALWSHGWNMERGFGTLREWAFQHSRLGPLAAADMILTYGESGKEWTRRWLPWKKIIAIGNTLDMAEIDAARAAAMPARFGNPQLLAVGRLTAEKRFDALIRVFKLVRRQLPGAVLTIVGDGPERQALEAAAGDELHTGIRFLGPMYGEENLAPLFLGADFFVLAGAAGLSVNHALGYGLPVIAYARGKGMPLHHPEIEYVVQDETGILCREPGDEALARVIVQAHLSGQSGKLRASIPGFVAAKMRLEYMIEQFARVDREL